MRPYEVMIIFDADLEEETIRSAVERSLALIESKGAERGQVDWWGKRRLAYEMKHRWEGYYVVLQARAEPAAMDELHRSLSLADEVIRHKVLRIPEHGLRTARRNAGDDGRHRRTPTTTSRRTRGRHRPPASDDSTRAASGMEARPWQTTRSPSSGTSPGTPRSATRRRAGEGPLRRRGEPALAEPPDQRVGGADQLLQRRVLGRHGRERQRSLGKGTRVIVTAGSSSAAGRPSRARSAASSRSSPTRSARACAGRPPRCTRSSAAVAAASGGGGGDSAAAAAVGGAPAAPGRRRARGGGGNQAATTTARSRLLRRRAHRGDEQMARDRRARGKKGRRPTARVQKKKMSILTPSRSTGSTTRTSTCCAGSCRSGPRSGPAGSPATTSSSSARSRRRSASPARWRCCPTACAR